MHLVFERSKGKFKSNCNILALAWTPYYNETKFRLALFDYHQRQLINLTSSIGINEAILGQQDQPRAANNARGNQANGDAPAAASAARLNRPTLSGVFLNSRVAELHQRHSYLKNIQGSSSASNGSNSQNKPDDEIAASKTTGSNITTQLDAHYGRMTDFGWLVIGNVGKIVGVTLTSLLPPPPPPPPQLDPQNSSLDKANPSNRADIQDLIQFHEGPSNGNPPAHNNARDTFRPDNGSMRENYNLRGHLDEVILVKWNELYQKLATIDSKGNVLIWSKINEKFSIQTPFYNRTKAVADFKWSNDGKTALICYTDSFILVGSSSGQRHWHSMLNLDDYHITCASWTPNDEQLLLGVSNGNVVVIDLPRSELTELVVNQTNIRTMCWSSSDLSLTNLKDNNEQALSTTTPGEQSDSTSSARSFSGDRRHSTVVNHRRLSRDCSVFSRYRFCSQAPSTIGSRSPGVAQPSPDMANPMEPWRMFTFQPPSYQNRSESSQDSAKSKRRNILAIDFANNTIKLYDEGLDDPEPRTIQVNQESYIMHWSGDGKYLAVAGFNIHTTAPSVGCLRCRYLNAIKFYNQQGQLIYEHIMNYTRYPITAFTWAHDDKRIFVATGPRLHCAKVFLGIPPLSLLAVSCFQKYTKIPDKLDILNKIIERKQAIPTLVNWQSHNCPVIMQSHSNKRLQVKPIIGQNCLIPDRSDEGDELAAGCESAMPNTCNNSNVFQYRLPLKLQIKIDNLFTRTVRQPFEEHWSLNDIIWHVPKNEQRYYCTLVCYADDRDINSSGHQYRTNMMNRSSDNHTSDQNKIFVLYVEFLGSLIPILRARRVGFLKPEFVIFDPEDSKSKLHRQRKVSDISQQSQFIDGVLQRRLENTANQSYLADYTNQTNQLSSYHYSNEGFADNCSDLHLYSEPRASSSSLGRQSMSDAEHYYNFDGDPLGRIQNPTPPNRLADLISDRSHHQEPIALPISGNPYLMYMMSLSSGHQQIQGRQNPLPMTPKRTTTFLDYKLKNRGGSELTSSKFTETNELLRIKSNIWGTKFKLINVGNSMIKQRSVLGSVAYKASILHLQPRQIFLTVKDMSNYCCLCSKHHHTRIQRHHNREINNQSEKANDVSLLDMPNLEEPLSTVKSGKIKRNGSLTKTSTHGYQGDDSAGKVVLAVGDSIRIAPKLEMNQRYRFSPTVQHDNDNSGVSNVARGEGRLYFEKLKSSESSSSKRSQQTTSESSGSSTKKSRSRKNKLKYGETRNSRTDMHRYPSSATHTSANYSQQLEVSTYGNTNRSNVTFNPRASSSRDISEHEDDILTLSLGQGDQVKVEMSSLVNLGAQHDHQKATENHLNEFLASNKTLKSIQTITKMIVDLSSKTDDLETFQSEQAADQPSPSKVARLSSSDSSPCYNKASTSRYVVPDTPVHRPRRVATQSHVSTGGNQVIERARSATSTPLKSFHQLSSRSHQRRILNKLDKAQNSVPLPPPPPPPPSIPIGRRLSSSAKRFIDGSLRSLYGGGSGSYSASDAEPEETEHLVTERTFRAKIAKDLLKHVPVVHSQPSTPNKKSSDITSLRAQLMLRLRGEKHTAQPIAAADSSYKPIKSGWRYNNRKNRGATSLNSSGLELNVDSPMRSTYDYNSSTSNSSTSSEDEDDNDLNFDLTDSELEGREAFKTHHQKTSTTTYTYGCSTSVNDLRSSGRPKRSSKGAQDAANKINGKNQKDKPATGNHRRRRRKAMCSNSSCCCAKEFKLSNRPPVWNELSQVYQLDFGGRVTQESAKNLQIDYDGKLALQFGRIDRSTYTLDYKYPFNAVQAMAIALASLTQRLK